MNYLYEINHFYSWLTTHPLSPHSQALWNLLMSIDNKAGWPEEFAVPTASLAAILRISRTQLTRCRKELAEAGRIIHLRQKGGRPAVYCLLRFEDEKAATVDKNADANGEEKPPRRKRLPANSPHRLNRTKLHLVQ